MRSIFDSEPVMLKRFQHEVHLQVRDKTEAFSPPSCLNCLEVLAIVTTKIKMGKPKIIICKNNSKQLMWPKHTKKKPVHNSLNKIFNKKLRNSMKSNKSVDTLLTKYQYILVLSSLDF